MFGEVELQKIITNQLTASANQICCSAVGTITSYDENNNIFLVQLDCKLKYNNQILSNSVYCKAYQEKNNRKPYEIGDRVFISFTDYNQNFPSTPIDVKKTKKHSLENGIILFNITEYNKIVDIVYGNENYNVNILGKDAITIKNKSEDTITVGKDAITIKNKSEDTVTVGKDAITIKNKFGTIIQLKNSKIYIGNGIISIYEILLSFIDLFSADNLDIFDSNATKCVFDGKSSTWGTKIKALINEVFSQSYENN